MLTDEQAKGWVNKPLYSSDGKNLGEVLSQLTRRGLRAAAAAAGTGKSGLPVFNVKPNATIIPSSRARALLAEDAT